MLMKRWIFRIAGILLLLFGLFFGGTIQSRQYCFGDIVFSALGLPSWSNGTAGTHYPAIVGIIFVIAGVILTTATLDIKYRVLFWGVAAIIIVMFCFWVF